MNDLVFFYPEGHEAHTGVNHPERPKRVEAIREALEDSGHWGRYPRLEPISVPEEVLSNIHTRDYLARLQAASERGGMLDAETYVTPASWQLALNAAGGAAAVTAAVWERDARRGFALCRPPGHHATANSAMGFCLMNNVAIAAEYLLQEKGAKRIAIVDIDLHHGNGTQDIFYSRGDVFFCSIHQHPLYPGTGHLNEMGNGDGEMTTANLPVPPYSGDQARTAAMDEVILPLLTRFAPEMILVSAGFDAHWLDPLGHQVATASGYGEVVGKLAAWADEHCGGRIALILEGGYNLSGNAACGLAVTQAMLGEAWSDTIGAGRIAEGEEWKGIIEQAKTLWGLP